MAASPDRDLAAGDGALVVRFMPVEVAVGTSLMMVQPALRISTVPSTKTTSDASLESPGRPPTVPPAWPDQHQPTCGTAEADQIKIQRQLKRGEAGMEVDMRRVPKGRRSRPGPRLRSAQRQLVPHSWAARWRRPHARPRSVNQSTRAVQPRPRHRPASTSLAWCTDSSTQAQPPCSGCQQREPPQRSKSASAASAGDQSGQARPACRKSLAVPALHGRWESWKPASCASSVHGGRARCMVPLMKSAPTARCRPPPPPSSEQLQDPGAATAATGDPQPDSSNPMTR